MKQSYKLLAVVLSVIMILSALSVIPFTAFAETEGIFTYYVNDGEATIAGINYLSGDIVIPSTIAGYPVTKIYGYDAWSPLYDYTQLKSVTIPDSVKIISGYTFAYCSELTSIKIPSSVTEIGYEAFSGCSGLTSIEIPNSVTDIGYGAFWGCSGLTSINIPESVSYIEGSVFKRCSALTSITVDENNPYYCSNQNCLIEKESKTIVATCKSSIIPDDGSATVIGEFAFSDRYDITDIAIPDNITSISANAFSGCTALETISLGSGVESIEEGAFSGCENLESVIIDHNNTNFCSAGNCLINTKSKTLIIGFDTSVIPDDGSVEKIADNAFSSCKGLTSVVIPNSVTAIGNNAFNGCCALTSITIPNSVKIIGTYAFYGCTELETVVLPDFLTKIGGYAFSGCENLAVINIPESVVEIGNGTFRDCVSIESFAMPSGIKIIGNSAFNGCTELKSIIMPNSVRIINDYAFYGCEKLTVITIPDSVEKIGFNAFYDTGYYNNQSNWESGLLYLGNHLVNTETSLIKDSCIIRNGIKTIADSTFSNCNGLKYVEIPDSVVTIGRGAFYYCTELTSIIIPDSVTEIGSGAFCYTGYYNDESNWDNGVLYINNYLIRAKSDVICGDYAVNESTKAIAGSAFRDCEELTSITIPDGITVIGSETFWGCSALESITFSDSVTSIGDYAFDVCTGLTSITIPNSVTSIGNSAFSGCTGLTSITIPDSVTSIGDYAFCRCIGLTSITIPDSVTEIGSYAFVSCESLTDVYYTGTEQQKASIIIDNLWNGNDCLLNATWHYNYGAVTDEEIFKYENVVNNHATITGLVDENTIGEITIPSTIGGYQVTSIDDNAFSGCTGLTSITIPDSVTEIGDYAFYGCTGLTSITIPDSVIEIGWGAFNDCTGLESITVDSGNPVYHSAGNCLIETEIKTLIFGCKKSVIPSDGSVTSIGVGAFEGCSGLTSIIIPNSVTWIYDGAFYNTGYYNDESNWENGVLYIGNHLIKANEDISGEYSVKPGTKAIACSAFSGCTGLTSITIPDSVTEIGDYAFYGCTGLTSITIPDSVIEIGWGAFNDCTGLESITVDSGNPVYHSAGNCLIETEIKTLIFGCKKSVIPSDGSVTSIGHGAFYGCSGLTSITIPDSVTEIGYGAFSDCTKLASIIIPNSVTWIYDGAFYNTGYYNDESNWENGVLYIGNHLIKANEDISGEYSVKPGTKAIACSAFSDCTEITSVTIPDSVTSIDDGAFSICKGLMSVTIGNSVTSIGNWAFYYCTELKSVIIPDSVTRIYQDAFSGCSNLADVYYTGTAQQKNLIIIEYGNDYLLNATWHYNYASSHKAGDISGDGSLNNGDLVLLFQYLSGWDVADQINKSAVDVNGDGKENNQDLVLLFQYLSGWEVEIF